MKEQIEEIKKIIEEEQSEMIKFIINEVGAEAFMQFVFEWCCNESNGVLYIDLKKIYEYIWKIKEEKKIFLKRKEEAEKRVLELLIKLDENKKHLEIFFLTGMFGGGEEDHNINIQIKR